MTQRSNKQIRVLFDTCIYGFLAKEPLLEQFEENLIHKDGLVVYGCRVIRKELRAAPKHVKIPLLELYDHITKSHDLKINASTEKLAAEYYSEAQKIHRNIKNYDELKNDYLIVAAASLANLDIVFSGDSGTMFSSINQNAYKLVNLKNKLRSPNFYDYKLLKKSYI